jgi:RHS repeat-associated protein
VGEGATQDRQKANTKEQDPTGLLNEGFRYRDPVTGTFITRDPLGFIDGPNMYTYVRQNPWTHFDPEGLQSDQSNTQPLPPSKQKDASSPNSQPPHSPTPTSTSQPGNPQPAQPKQASSTATSSTTSSAKNQLQALVVTPPSGKAYEPMSEVKDDAQAKIFGVPVGTKVPIFVPAGVDPQKMVDQWSTMLPHPFDFKKFWSDPKNDFKDPVKSPGGSPIYDAFGNFMYGSTGRADQLPGSLLQHEANKLHPKGQSSINTRDIQSGIDTHDQGGKLSAAPYP